MHLQCKTFDISNVIICIKSLLETIFLPPPPPPDNTPIQMPSHPGKASRFLLRKPCTDNLIMFIHFLNVFVVYMNVVLLF